MRRLIVPTNWGCEIPFQHMYDEVLHSCPSEITRDDTLVLEGGTDIGPSLYRQRRGSHTGHPDVSRDRDEHRLLVKFALANASILAICRGAQLVTAFAGGRLIQHVNNHGSGNGHGVVTKDNLRLWTASLHHQMMYPFELPKEDYEIIAYTPHQLSTVYLDQNDLEMSEMFPENFVEPEIVWYPKLRCLAIQGHPEYQSIESKFVKYCHYLVEKHIFRGAPKQPLLLEAF